MEIPSKLRKNLERVLGARVGMGRVVSKSDFRHVTFETSIKTAK